MRRAVPLIIGCLLILATVESTFAQQRLFANTGRAFVELDPRLPSLGAVIRRFSLVPRADTVAGLDARAPLNRDAVSFGGGAFIAWASTHGVALFNTSSGAVQEFTFPDFVGSKVIGTDGVARLLVLGTNAAEHLVVVVADARAGSTHLLDLGPRRRGGPIAYAWASDVLFIARPRTMTVFGGFDFFDVEVIDVKTGAVLKTVDTSPAYVEFLSTNAAGTRLFVTDLLTGTAAFDVATGAILASGTSRGLAYGFPIVVDEARNRLVVNLDGVEAFSGTPCSRS